MVAGSASGDYDRPAWRCEPRLQRARPRRMVRSLCYVPLATARGQFRGYMLADANQSSGRTAPGVDLVTVPEDPEGRRAFLQVRVALFGRMLAVVSSVFLFSSASSYFLLAP